MTVKTHPRRFFLTHLFFNPIRQQLGLYSRPTIKRCKSDILWSSLWLSPIMCLLLLLHTLVKLFYLCPIIMKPFGPLNLFQYFIFLLRVRSISKAWLDTYSRPSAAAANGIICRPGRLKFLSFGGKPQSDSEFRTEEILIWGSPRMEKNKFPMNHEFLFPTSWFSRHSENKWQYCHEWWMGNFTNTTKV